MHSVISLRYMLQNHQFFRTQKITHEFVYLHAFSLAHASDASFSKRTSSNSMPAAAKENRQSSPLERR